MDRLNKEYEFNQSISIKPIKVTIPGPLTITDTIADEFYHDHKKLGVDLGEAINKEIKSLVNSGCKYIQVDEPLFAENQKSNRIWN